MVNASSNGYGIKFLDDLTPTERRTFNARVLGLFDGNKVGANKELRRLKEPGMKVFSLFSNGECLGIVSCNEGEKNILGEWLISNTPKSFLLSERKTVGRILVSNVRAYAKRRSKALIPLLPTPAFDMLDKRIKAKRKDLLAKKLIQRKKRLLK